MAKFPDIPLHAVPAMMDVCVCYPKLALESRVQGLGFRYSGVYRVHGVSRYYPKLYTLNHLQAVLIANYVHIGCVSSSAL